MSAIMDIVANILAGIGLGLLLVRAHKGILRFLSWRKFRRLPKEVRQAAYKPFHTAIQIGKHILLFDFATEAERQAFTKGVYEGVDFFSNAMKMRGILPKDAMLEITENFEDGQKRTTQSG